MKSKIIKRNVEAVTPGERDTFLWDTELTGFGCKVTPAGNRVYVVQYRFAGRIRRYTIGKHGAPWTPEQARQEASRILGVATSGRDPSQIKAAGRSAPTVAQLADRYIEDHATPHKKPRSVEEDRRNLRLHILPALGRRRVGDVTRADVINLHRNMRGSPIGANRVIALFSKMMNLAEKWGLRPDGSNPCRHVEKNKERGRERFLSADELARLGDVLASAEEEGSETPSAITAIRLLVLTGARKSEILTARWDYVDFERACLRLPDSKTGEKLILLGAAALEVLQSASRIDGNPYVCPGEKHDAHLVGLHRAWERIRARAGLRGTRLHDLRHSYASVGASGGYSLVVLGALLGHRTQATTAKYAHLADDPIRAAADRISGQIDAAMRRKAGGEVVELKRQPS